MFPIIARDLVKRAFERVEEQSNSVKQQLLDIYLPRTAEVILSRQPDCRALLKGHFGTQMEQSQLINKIGQTLWSHPGSLGGAKIERIFLEAGFDLDAADTLATQVVRYSRYSMAVVNHLRHVRSAIQGFYDLVVLENMRERFLANVNMESWLQSEWLSHAKTLANRKISNVSELSEWLSDIELLLSALKLHSSSNIDINSSEQFNLQNYRAHGIGGNAKAYTRRFGQYINQEFKIVGLGGRYATREESVLDELAKLKTDLAGDETRVFKMLEADYLQRQSRIKVSTKPPRSRTLDRNSMYENLAKSLLSNHFQIDDRELIIRSSSQVVPQALLEQMVRVFQTQIKIEPDLKRFIGKVIADGHELEVELEKPTKKDGIKIKQYLDAYFNH